MEATPNAAKLPSLLKAGTSATIGYNMGGLRLSERYISTPCTSATPDIPCTMRQSMNRIEAVIPICPYVGKNATVKQHPDINNELSTIMDLLPNISPR